MENKQITMAQQTAVEWLVEQMIYQMAIRIENTTIGCELFEQAKQMEKEQIVNAYDAGLFDGTMDDVNDRIYKQYYNETYQ